MIRVRQQRRGVRFSTTKNAYNTKQIFFATFVFFAVKKGLSSSAIGFW